MVEILHRAKETPQSSLGWLAQNVGKPAAATVNSLTMGYLDDALDGVDWASDAIGLGDGELGEGLRSISDEVWEEDWSDSWLGFSPGQAGQVGATIGSFFIPGTQLARVGKAGKAATAAAPAVKGSGPAGWLTSGIAGYRTPGLAAYGGAAGLGGGHLYAVGQGEGTLPERVGDYWETPGAVPWWSEDDQGNTQFDVLETGLPQPLTDALFGAVITPALPAAAAATGAAVSRIGEKFSPAMRRRLAEKMTLEMIEDSGLSIPDVVQALKRGELVLGDLHPNLREQFASMVRLGGGEQTTKATEMLRNRRDNRVQTQLGEFGAAIGAPRNVIDDPIRGVMTYGDDLIARADTIPSQRGYRHGLRFDDVEQVPQAERNPADPDVDFTGPLSRQEQANQIAEQGRQMGLERGAQDLEIMSDGRLASGGPERIPSDDRLNAYSVPQLKKLLRNRGLPIANNRDAAIGPQKWTDAQGRTGPDGGQLTRGDWLEILQRQRARDGENGPTPNLDAARRAPVEADQAHQDLVAAETMHRDLTEAVRAARRGKNSGDLAAWERSPAGKDLLGRYSVARRNLGEARAAVRQAERSQPGSADAPAYGDGSNVSPARLQKMKQALDDQISSAQTKGKRGWVRAATQFKNRIRNALHTVRDNNGQRPFKIGDQYHEKFMRAIDGLERGSGIDARTGERKGTGIFGATPESVIRFRRDLDQVREDLSADTSLAPEVRAHIAEELDAATEGFRVGAMRDYLQFLQANPVSPGSKVINDLHQQTRAIVRELFPPGKKGDQDFDRLMQRWQDHADMKETEGKITALYDTAGRRARDEQNTEAIGGRQFDVVDTVRGAINNLVENVLVNTYRFTNDRVIRGLTRSVADDVVSMLASRDINMLTGRLRAAQRRNQPLQMGQVPPAVRAAVERVTAQHARSAQQRAPGAAASATPGRQAPGASTPGGAPPSSAGDGAAPPPDMSLTMGRRRLGEEGVEAVRGALREALDELDQLENVSPNEKAAAISRLGHAAEEATEAARAASPDDVQQLAMDWQNVAFTLHEQLDRAVAQSVHDVHRASRAEGELARAGEHVSILEREKLSLERSLDRWLRQSSEMMRTINGLRGYQAVLQNRLGQASDRLAETGARLALTEKRLIDTTDQVAKLRQAVETGERSLADAQSEISRLETELADAHAQMKDMRSLDHIERAIDESWKEDIGPAFEGFRRRNRRAVEIAENAINENTLLRDELNHLRRENAELSNLMRRHNGEAERPGELLTSHERDVLRADTRAVGELSEMTDAASRDLLRQIERSSNEMRRHAHDFREGRRSEESANQQIHDVLERRQPTLLDLGDRLLAIRENWHRLTPVVRDSQEAMALHKRLGNLIDEARRRYANGTRPPPRPATWAPSQLDMLSMGSPMHSKGRQQTPLDRMKPRDGADSALAKKAMERIRRVAGRNIEFADTLEPGLGVQAGVQFPSTVGDAVRILAARGDYTLQDIDHELAHILHRLGWMEKISGVKDYNKMRAIAKREGFLEKYGVTGRNAVRDASGRTYQDVYTEQGFSGKELEKKLTDEALAEFFASGDWKNFETSKGIIQKILDFLGLFKEVDFADVYRRLDAGDFAGEIESVTRTETRSASAQTSKQPPPQRAARRAPPPKDPLARQGRSIAPAAALGAAQAGQEQRQRPTPDMNYVFGDAARRFRTVLRKAPGKEAAPMFRQAALRHPSVFYWDDGTPKTVSEVGSLF